jgi:uncharacterized protein YegL
MKIKKSNRAVSEIFGTMLLLTITVLVFSAIYIFVLSDEGPNPEIYVKITGQVIGSNVIFEHQGGESLELDTKISITIAGEEYNRFVSDLLKDKNNDDKWNLGERMTFPFEYNLSRLGQYREVDVTAVDEESNSIVLTGPIELHPVSDAGMTITVDNPYPTVGDVIKITIIVTSYGGDVNGSGDVSVRCLLPEELHYIDSFSPSGHGLYNNETGIWSTGDVLVGYPARIYINATVLESVETELIQLGVILDGSGSISSSDWDLMKDGLSEAIKNESIFPYEDGRVELTVIQFGGGSFLSNSFAQVEINPVIISDDEFDPVGYYLDIANDIQGINQLEGLTPMGCGIRLAADQLHDIGNFSIDKRQILILVTDGEPNCVWIPGTYTASYEGSSQGKTSAEEARTYLINNLEMNDQNDEFDSLAVGSGPDIPWLNNSIVWPEPGYIAPPYENGTGWVSQVETWDEFSDAIEIILDIIFNGITNSVELISSTTLDPNDTNNYAAVLIVPND